MGQHTDMLQDVQLFINLLIKLLTVQAMKFPSAFGALARPRYAPSSAIVRFLVSERAKKR